MKASTIHKVRTEGSYTCKDGRVITPEQAEEAVTRGWAKFNGVMGGEDVMEAYEASLLTAGTITHAKSVHPEDFFSHVGSKKGSTNGRPRNSKGQFVKGADEAPAAVVDSATLEQVVLTAVKAALEALR